MVKKSKYRLYEESCELIYKLASERIREKYTAWEKENPESPY